MKNKNNTTQVTTAPTTTLSMTSPKTNKKIMAIKGTTTGTANLAGNSKTVATFADAMFLQAKVAEQAAFIDEITKLVNALDSNIDWDTNKPVSKIRKFGLFIFNNWSEIFNIIKAIITLVKSR